jgi:predicted AAA+ superfamily ATPase
MVASHLLKFCDYQQDVYGHKMELRFLRDNTGKECDFVVLKNKKPEFAVECKLNDTNISPTIHYLKERTNIPRWYQVFLNQKKSKIITPNLSVLSFEDFCKKEDLV